MRPMNAATESAPPRPQVLSTQQAAAAWGVSRWRIYDLVREGKIRPIIGMGKGWKFLFSDFESVEFTRL